MVGREKARRYQSPHLILADIALSMDVAFKEHLPPVSYECLDTLEN